MSAPELQRGSPYQGLIPYDEADAPFFFGREKETRLIIANLFASPLTLLYGASGVGKSSVLRAGVARQLRTREELLVVVFNAWQSNPLVDLKNKIAEAAGRLNVRLEVPSDSTHLSNFLATCAAQLDRRLMIILDQFEEYFLYHPQEDEFAAEFSRAVTQSGAPLSFLISIREDFYAKLDRFEGRVPTLYDNYLRIEHLDRKAARVAIEKPITEYNRQYAADGHFSIEPQLVDTVLRQVETGRVIIGEAGRGVIEAAGTAEEGSARIETPFLQLVMTRLWEKELGDRSNKLRLKTLNDLGGAENIVRTHLDAVVTKLSARDQEIAAGMFHYLVTPSGTKIAYTASDLAGSAELSEAEAVRVLDDLSHGDVRILRTVEPSPDRPGAPRYEIFHDVLAPAILSWRTAYVQTQERADAERRAEEQEKRADEQARVAKRLRRLSVALAVVALLALASTVFAFQQRRQAQAFFSQAKTERERAETQAELARKRGLAADKAEIAAKDAQTVAVAAEEKAETSRQETAEQIKIAEQRKAEAEQAQGVARVKSAAAAQANIAASRATVAANEQASATRVAFSNLLSVQSGTLLDERPQLSTLLAVEAMRATNENDPPTPAAEAALRQGLAQTGGRVFSAPWAKDEAWNPTDVAVSADGRWLMSSGNTVVTLFDLNLPDASAPVRTFNNAGPPIAFSPDGRWLFAVGMRARSDKPEDKTRENHVLMWDLENGPPNPQPIILPGPAAGTNRIIISPDSRWLVASSDASNIARLWDLKSSDRLVKNLSVAAPAGSDQSDGTLAALAISPDSRWLVTSAGDIIGGLVVNTVGPVRLWNLTAADPAAKPLELSGHKSAVSEAVFSSNGRWLATTSTGCDDGVRLWDLQTTDATAKPVVLDHKGAIGAIAFSNDSKFLVTAGGLAQECPTDFTARVWDLNAPNIAAKSARLPAHEGPIFFSFFSPDNSFLITVAGRGYSIVPGFGVSDMRTARQLGLAEGGATARAWYWAAGTEEGSIESEGETIPNVVLRDDKNAADLFMVSPDHRWLLARSDNRAVAWDLTAVGGGGTTIWPATVIRGHDGNLSAMAFSSDSRRLVTGGADKSARVWELSAGAFAVTPLTFPKLAYKSPIIQSADQHLLVATTDEKPVPGKTETSEESYARGGAVAYVLNLAAKDPAEPRFLHGHKGKIKSAAFSANNRWLATGSNDKTARLWDLTAADPAARPLVFAGHQGAVDDVAISPDGHWLATASHDGAARLWDLTATDPTAHSVVLTSFKSPAGESYQYVHRVYMSPDSRWLVTSGSYHFNAPARLWDLKAPDPSASSVELGHINTEFDFVCAFSPDGRWLIVSRDIRAKEEALRDDVHLWDLTRKPLAAPFALTGGPKKFVSHVAFSSDGRWLFTSGYEKMIRRWNLTAPDPTAAPLSLSSPLTETDETSSDLALSSDDRWLVAKSKAGGTHILWDLRANDPNAARYVLKNPDAMGLSAVAFDPASRWLVTSSDGSVSETIRILTKRDIASSGTHNLRWDLTAADPSVAPVALPGKFLISKHGVSADGRWLITAPGDALRLWKMRVDELIDLACRTAGRNLSEEEWRTYFPGQPYRRTCGDQPERQ